MNKNPHEHHQMCFLCGEFIENFYNSTRELTKFSKTSLKALLETFLPLNLNNIPQNSSNDSKICQNCFIKLNELDEHQMIAEKIKSDFIKVFNQIYDVKNHQKCNENLQLIYPEVLLDFEEHSEVKIKIEPEAEEQKDFDEAEDQERENFVEISRKLKKKISKNLKKSQTTKFPEKPKKLHRVHPKPMDDSVEIRIENADTIFKCKICNKIMKHRGHMQQHILAHKNVRNFCCQECGMTFKLKSHLTSHYKTHTGKKDKMICDICGKLFDQKFYLREHMNAIHLDIRKFTCSICFMTFARKRCLLGHARVHQDESLKKVVCEVCGFRTHTKQAMKRHSRTHTGEKNFACNICGKMFACDYNVTAHVNSVHKGIRPKVDESKMRCNFCGRKFTRQKQLRRHLFEDHQVMEHAAEFSGD